MPVLTLKAKLDRSDANTPWGFRMQGGKDFSAPLSIQRVTPGSLAAKCGIQVGDSITHIGGHATENLKHKDAQSVILGSGNYLELTLLRGGSPTSSAGSVLTSVPPLQQVSPLITQQKTSTQQSWNAAPKPFSSTGSADPLVQKTAALSLQSGAGAGRPAEAMSQWQSQPAPVAQRPLPTVAKPWQPKQPTGPRKMRVGRAGEARQMGAGSTGRIPVCAACNVSIRGPFVLALDQTWCPDHFACANPNCRAPLVETGFVEEGGQLFCARDYEQFFAPRCAKCSSAIIGDCINALQKTYHPHCFVCGHCRQPIPGGSFHLEDGLPYCERDWQALYQTKCIGCSFPIEPGDKWVEALGQNWHSECFNCSTCQVNLEGQPFYAKGGRPYCKKHAKGGY